MSSTIAVRKNARSLAKSSARRQAGLVTAEYAIAAVAAVGFGGVLLKVLTSDGVFSLLLKIIEWLLSLITGQKVL
jgi:Protein of unknown function (DUF4244)